MKTPELKKDGLSDMRKVVAAIKGGRMQRIDTENLAMITSVVLLLMVWGLSMTLLVCRFIPT